MHTDQESQISNGNTILLTFIQTKGNYRYLHCYLLHVLCEREQLCIEDLHRPFFVSEFILLCDSLNFFLAFCRHYLSIFSIFFTLKLLKYAL